MPRFFPIYCVLLFQLAYISTTTFSGTYLLVEANVQADTTAGELRPNQGSDKNAEPQVYLESMEDLEHVAYLSLRNFNLTDEGLLQSSWPLSLGSALVHKQKGSISSALTSTIYDSKERLALMLESFILHLRNGHMRRMELEELELLVAQVNDQQSSTDKEKLDNATLKSETNSNVDRKSSPYQDETGKRCNHLVTIYEFELRQRYKSMSEQSESRNDYDQSSQQPVIDKRQSGEESIYNHAKYTQEPQIDVKRLKQLCRLVVDCQSADQLVDVISVPWKRNPKFLKLTTSSQDDQHLLRNSQTTKSRRFILNDLKHQETAREVEDSNVKSPDHDQTGKINRFSSHKTLRDSLSLSLAKLCPLMLFQLHEDDAICMVRRDDRPPMITVWGFATLFVTIVCFCSLIGLSITPLLGPTVSEETQNVDFINGSADFRHSDKNQFNVRVNEMTTRTNNHNYRSRNRRQDYKASLTLFEGLAVGSLVGSALFSLIPQAFELQERESNQGFLLKAFIIFFGIYLFFCSERLMRIILDTRQLHKKRKRLNHRSSNSMASPVDGFAGARQSQSLDSQQQMQLNHQRYSNESTGRLSNVYYPDDMVDASKYFYINRKRQEQKDPIKLSRGVEFSSIGTVRSKTKTKPKDDHHKNPKADRGKAKQVNSIGSKTRSKRARRRETRQKLLAAKRRNQIRHQRIHHPNSQQQLTTLTNPLDKQNASSHSTDSSWSSSSSSSSSISASPALNRWGQQVIACASEEEMQFGDYDVGDSSGDENPFGAHFDFDSDDSDNGVAQLQQIRAVNRKMNQYSARFGSHDNSQLRYGHYMSAKNIHGTDQGHQSQKQDISTVAWMIVLGDGLHNFIDGISIGAAFSESILSGVSISVAVICEEFPHELGDFAVLVSSGMTVRQALGYNFLSACTCYIGMAVGIILGDVNDGASYISALAAGVFLYIALVDMMGELSATLEDTSRDSITKALKLFLLQNIGIFIGISIIFVLSFIDF